MDSKLWPSTKRALENEVRAIVARTPIETPIVGEDLSFMVELFQMHPMWLAKWAGGVRSIVIRENRGYGMRPTLGFWLIRTDDSEVDISWRECIYPTPHHAKVRAAMRLAVTEQLVDCRRRWMMSKRAMAMGGHAYQCDACGNDVANEDAEVDHQPPQEFKTMVAEFLSAKKFLFTDIAVEHGPRGDKLQDEELARDWREWHEQRALLWLVCKPCHKRLTADRKTDAAQTGGE